MHSKKRTDDAFSLLQKSDLKVFIAIVALLFAVVVLLLTTLARVAFSDPLPCKACASPPTSSDAVGAEGFSQTPVPYEAVPLRPLNGSRAKLMRTPEVRLRAVSIHDDVSNEIAEVVEEIADDFPSPLPLFNEVDAETGNSEEEEQQSLEDKSDAIPLPKAEFFLGSRSPALFAPTAAVSTNTPASAPASLPPPVQTAFAIEVQPAQKDAELPELELVDYDTYDSKPRLMDATMLEGDPIPLPGAGDSNGTEVDNFNRTVLADQPIDPELEGAKVIKQEASKECAPLNPYAAARLHPMSERGCGDGLPGWQDPSGKCFCTYFPAEWDKNDCPSKYYTMCWKED